MNANLGGGVGVKKEWQYSENSQTQKDNKSYQRGKRSLPLGARQGSRGEDYK